MITTAKAGWTPDKGADELDMVITIVGDSPQEVEHLMSLTSDDWKVGVSSNGSTIVLDVKATRKMTLADQAAQKKAAQEAAAEDAVAKAAQELEDAKVQAEKQNKLNTIASVAAKAAVEALKDQV